MPKTIKNRLPSSTIMLTEKSSSKRRLFGDLSRKSLLAMSGWQLLTFTINASASFIVFPLTVKFSGSAIFATILILVSVSNIIGGTIEGATSYILVRRLATRRDYKNFGVHVFATLTVRTAWDAIFGSFAAIVVWRQYGEGASITMMAYLTATSLHFLQPLIAKGRFKQIFITNLTSRGMQIFSLLVVHAEFSPSISAYMTPFVIFAICNTVLSMHFSKIHVTSVKTPKIKQYRALVIIIMHVLINNSLGLIVNNSMPLLLNTFGASPNDVVWFGLLDRAIKSSLALANSFGAIFISRSLTMLRHGGAAENYKYMATLSISLVLCAYCSSIPAYALIFFLTPNISIYQHLWSGIAYIIVFGGFSMLNYVVSAHYIAAKSQYGAYNYLSAASTVVYFLVTVGLISYAKASVSSAVFGLCVFELFLFALFITRIIYERRYTEHKNI